MTGWIRHQYTFLFVFFLTVIAVTWGVWRYGYVQALAQLEQRRRSDLALAADRFASQIQSYQEQAVLLAEHPYLAALSENGRSAEADRLLLEIVDKTAALDMLYVDTKGHVLASAQDWQDREGIQKAPHFQRAMHGALGTSHEVSARYGQRVYHVAAP